MKYNVKYQGIDHKFKTFYCSINSDEPKNITFRVYNTYFDEIEYQSSLIFSPGINYWNYIVTNHQHRYVEFIDNDTTEIVGQFTIPGGVNFFDYDCGGYAKRIHKLIPKNEKTALLNVFNEIVCQDIYSNEFLDIEENDTVVDIGFNYGIFAVTALRKKPKRIIGFEPSNKLCEVFTNNFNDEKITLVNCAVSDEDKVVKFYESEISVMATIKEDLIHEKSNYSYEIPALGINTIIEKYNLDKIDYLKVDCEGSEYDIFESISDEYLASSIRKIAIEIHDNVKDSKVIRLIDKLHRCGFNTREIDGGSVGLIYAIKGKF